MSRVQCSGGQGSRGSLRALSGQLGTWLRDLVLGARVAQQAALGAPVRWLRGPGRGLSRRAEQGVGGSMEDRRTGSWWW
ncbi:unnamed protein product [Arctogadus glacialis]